MLLVLVQQRGTSPAFLVLKGRGVVGLSISPDPVVDPLPGDSEHASNVGGGTTAVKLQDGKGTPKDAGIPGHRELTPQAPPLPGGQVEPAHGILLNR